MCSERRKIQENRIREAALAQSAIQRCKDLSEAVLGGPTGDRVALLSLSIRRVPFEEERLHAFLHDLAALVNHL